MFLGEVENFPLLLPEGKGDEGSGVPVTDIEPSEEPLYVAEIKGDSKSPN